MILKTETFDLTGETERVVIRLLKKQDYAEWLNGYTGRLEAQHKHDPGNLDMEECTEEWFKELVRKHQELARNDIAHVFGVFRKGDGKHIGMVDFSTLARNEFQWGRIGYTIHNQFWNRGYGKEAVKKALYMAFEGLGFHRIEAHINLDNIPSTKLAESAGMKFECKREGFLFEDGKWTDHLVYYATGTNFRFSDL
ncbi:GNAT family N-acetyltransferase [Planococcus halotolerans]|uniref:N-acetyltransferase n=1 Tax=Planococcus halotolerans TaxID=2233542 RepID=A0A365L1H1_9BACL|nr:GNAT family N-acetyltransferase [Planococcus halotolerans]RAZ79278.1 N-acetyltransferase [Planococcus halotolerans]